MSEEWDTKYGPRRVRRDPPTLDEAIFAAAGITDDQQGQAEIASALMGMPFDSSFLVTTVNKNDFAKAGVTTMPTTLAQFSADLKKVGKANGMANPLDIQFAAAEGLSTCWYQTTAAFGGQVLTAQDTPAFTSPSSPGYQAMTWLVNAYKSGLVPKGNINTTDYQGFTTEMA